MGTRSLTRIIPRQEGLSFNEGHTLQELSHVNMYRHLDGYPEGHGLELAEFLKDVEIVRGVPLVNKTRYPKENEPCYIAIYEVYNKKCIFVGTPRQLLDKYKPNTNEKG